MTQNLIIQNSVHYADCEYLMPKIIDGSVDMICADLPYGTTKNRWDVIIDPEMLWQNYWRMLKPNGCVVLFGQDKFTAQMMMSSKHHRYNLIWQKTSPTGFLNSKRMPLRDHEDMMIFYKKLPTYNPQKTTGHPRKVSTAEHKRDSKKTTNYGEHNLKTYDSTERYPKSVWKFKTDKQKSAIHPTQKPVALIEELIKTYTNEGETVLDNTAGSMTTGIACINTNRKYILIESDPEIYEKGLARLQSHIDSRSRNVAVAEKRKENTRRDED